MTGRPKISTTFVPTEEDGPPSAVTQMDGTFMWRSPLPGSTGSFTAGSSGSQLAAAEGPLPQAQVSPAPAPRSSGSAAGIFGGAPQDPLTGLVGSVVSGYRIERMLGQGGMGTVYFANQLKPQRAVAMKVLSPVLCRDPELALRFEREANALARVDSPYVVPIYQMFEAHECICLTMAYLPGGSVRKLLVQQKRLDEVRAAKIVRQTALGLWAAAQEGIVHRDVKPDNLLLTAHGDVKIADFGLVKAVGASDLVTNSGTLVGTPAYMSPEQFRESHAVDHRSDLYALGCCLFELVTGQQPFAGPHTMEYMQQHCDTSAPDPAALRPDISPAMRAIILRLLAKDPGQRFQDGRELARALLPMAEEVPAPPVQVGVRPSPSPVLAGQPQVAVPPKTAAGIPGRTLVIAAVAGVLTLGLLVLAAVSLLSDDTPRNEALAAREAANERRQAVDRLGQTLAARMLTISRKISQLETAMESGSADPAPLQSELADERRERDALLGLSGVWQTALNESPVLAELDGLLERGEGLLQDGEYAAAQRAFEEMHTRAGSLLEVERAHTARQAADVARRAWGEATAEESLADFSRLVRARTARERADTLAEVASFQEAAVAYEEATRIWDDLTEGVQQALEARAHALVARQGWEALEAVEVGGEGPVGDAFDRLEGAERALAQGQLDQARRDFASGGDSLQVFSQTLARLRALRQEATALVEAWQQRSFDGFDEAPLQRGLTVLESDGDDALWQGDFAVAEAAFLRLVAGYTELVKDLPAAHQARERAVAALAALEELLTHDESERLLEQKRAILAGIELSEAGEFSESVRVLEAAASFFEGQRQGLIDARQASDRVMAAIGSWTKQFMEVETAVRDEIDRAMQAYTAGRTLLSQGAYDSAGVTLLRAEALLLGCLEQGPALLEGLEQLPELEARCERAARSWQAMFAATGASPPRPIAAPLEAATSARDHHQYHVAAREFKAALAGYRAAFGGCLPDWDVQPDQQAVAEQRELPVSVINSREMSFALIPAGRFELGSAEDGAERDWRDDDETPHRVTLSRAMYVLTHEVTQQQWKLVMGREPQYFDRADLHAPVESISWFDAIEFCNQLSRDEGLPEVYKLDVIKREQGVIIQAVVTLLGHERTGYRLPTESEWEYACRAKTETAVYTGPLQPLSDFEAPRLDGIAWYGGNSRADYFGAVDLALIYDPSAVEALRARGHTRRGPQAVGAKQENPWGLHDMLGNVSEWCWDVYDVVASDSLVDPLGPEKTGKRIHRGGSWRSPFRECRAADRARARAYEAERSIGLRLVRTIP